MAPQSVAGDLEALQNTEKTSIVYFNIYYFISHIA